MMFENNGVLLLWHISTYRIRKKNALIGNRADIFSLCVKYHVRQEDDIEIDSNGLVDLNFRNSSSLLGKAQIIETIDFRGFG